MLRTIPLIGRLLATMLPVSVTIAAYADTSTPTPLPQPAAVAAPTPADPAKKALIEQMLKVMRTEEQSKQLADAILSESPAIVGQIFPEQPDLTADQQKVAEDRAAKAVDRFQELFKQKVDIPSIVRSVTFDLYDKYFTADQIKDLIAFYKTPTGQKAIEVLPQLSQESMKLTDDALAPQIKAIVQQMQDEDKAGSSKADATPAK